MSEFYQTYSHELIVNQLRDSPNYVEVIRLLAEDFVEDVHVLAPNKSLATRR